MTQILTSQEARLPPAIPVEVDGVSVAMGSAAPGPYPLADGSEAYGRAATVTVLSDGSSHEIGVGGALRLGTQTWVATSFEADGTLVLLRSEAVDVGLEVPGDAPPIIYPDAEMANLWVQWHLPFATWRVDLKEVVRRNPAELENFVAAVTEAGERTGVMRILQIPAYGYRREEEGPLMPHLQKRWKAQGGADLFNDMGGLVVESKMAWLDGTGRLFDTPVRHLELILEMDEPYENALEGLRESWPPVSIKGSGRSAIERATQGLPTGPIELEISLHSDIWFPWITGMAHPLSDYKRKFDNRVLAERHTPRLNTFLAEVSAAARSLGTRLRLDRDECRVRPEFVDDHGVVLDVPAPAEQMTEADRNAPWT